MSPLEIMMYKGRTMADLIGTQILALEHRFLDWNTAPNVIAHAETCYICNIQSTLWFKESTDNPWVLKTSLSLCHVYTYFVNISHITFCCVYGWMFPPPLKVCPASTPYWPKGAIVVTVGWDLGWSFSYRAASDWRQVICVVWCVL